jgi:anaphase-promoting complex subunit 3
VAHNLPRCHFESGWVKHALGKAYFEMCEYKPAYIAFKDMVRLEPFRIEGIDILSTTLYHLRKDKDLSSLAQQVVEVDKLSPEAWCVVGNCFGLQKETDTAIKFFERALQIDPSFTYAHTLCGHEMLSNEDLEKATKSYESALRYDGRHYNALFGLGTIAHRKENYKEAEHHFRKAISINPVSSKLQGHLGMTLHTQVLLTYKFTRIYTRLVIHKMHTI